MDVTESVRPNWPAAHVLDYDESWCAALDLKANRNLEDVQHPTRMCGGGYEIDTLSTSDSLFQMHDDPVAFDSGLARDG
jgi:hypothetical protein